MIALIGAAIELAGKLINIGTEYATASAEKRAELIAKANADVLAYFDFVAKMPEKLAENNAAADAALDKKFGAK